MKTGVISDIEGNDRKLEQVLSELRGCDLIINLGDSAGNKGDTDRVVRLLRQQKIVSILGNHDLEIILKKDVAPSELLAPIIHESSETFYPEFDVSRESLDFFKALAIGLEINSNCFKYGFYHSLYGKYKEDIFFEYVDRSNALSLVEHTGCDVVFIGHKHVPGIFEIDENKTVKVKKINESTSFTLNPDKKYIINVGSLGAPRYKKIECSYSILALNDHEAKPVLKR
ncbi:MAG: metallophosphoesterase family protein [Desulfobacterales bacterium]|jgi:predicted phosphodiesterase